MYQVAACPKQDSLPHSTELKVCVIFGSRYIDFKKFPTLEEINALPPLESSLLKSLFARACFRGMLNVSLEQ